MIDGQHRTTAAALRGIEQVPAAIYKTDRAAQAAAFAAINGEVTAISTLALFRAQLVAGDAQALDIAAICKQAGVTILAQNPSGKVGTRLGETVAVRAIERCLVRYGTEVLVMALRALVACPTSVGLLRRPSIGAMCAVLDAEPPFQKPKLLAAAMKTFDLKAAWSKATAAQVAERSSIESMLVDLLADHIERGFKTREAA